VGCPLRATCKAEEKKQLPKTLVVAIASVVFHSALETGVDRILINVSLSRSFRNVIAFGTRYAIAIVYLWKPGKDRVEPWFSALRVL
jgi:hypothetical protein